MNTEPKYYMLKLESYQGETSSLLCFSHTDTKTKHVFCVVAVWPNNAVIVDAGYLTAEELLAARTDIVIANPKQTDSPDMLKGKAKYYILAIESQEWKLCQIGADADGNDMMLCVLIVHDNGMTVIDWGYADVAQLLEAWNDKTFQNQS